MKQPSNTTSAGHGPGCLARAIVNAMKVEPAIEAVKIDRAAQTVNLATLGKVNDSSLENVLTEEIRQTREQNPDSHCDLLVGSGNCSECKSPLPASDRDHIQIQHEASTTTITRLTCPTAPKFWRWRSLPLPRFVPREVFLPEDSKEEEEWKPQLVAAALCGVFGLAGYILGNHPAAIWLHVLAFLAGACYPAHEVWEKLQERELDVHFLMIAVAVGSACIGAWDEGTMLLFLFSLSGALEHYAMGRTHREIRALFHQAPKEAVQMESDGTEHSVRVDQLKPGIRLLVRPGEQFPVDAEVVKGNSASDESTLTGEATPVDKKIGDAVFAGTINLWGVVEVTVTRSAQESSLQKIITLIREAQHLKAPSQRFTDYFGTWYTYIILGLSAVMFLVWWGPLGHPAFVSTGTDKSAFYRAMTLLVVASPCALVLSIPSAVLAAIAWAARRGILFRGGAAVEKLAEVNVVAMDKTGTLTTGELEVSLVESYPPGREDEVLRHAFSLEKLSTHPLARAVTRHGKQRQLTALPLDHFESVAGSGIRAVHQGRAVSLGRREWIAQIAPTRACQEAPAAVSGVSEVWLVCGDLVGRILLRDDLRPVAGQLVARLRQLGLRSVVLTGDRHGAAESLKTQLELDEVRAELKPEQKVKAILELTGTRNRVAMIGDGVNDAPSLAVAHVGVAMGARGSAAALEQAEVVLMHDRLENFLAAFELSRRARLIIRQNLVISLGTVVVLVGFAIAGTIPLTLGVMGHEGSTVIVVLNSLRLLLGGHNVETLKPAG
jgi:Cd2+/Zn2+-exporting ATPase